MMLENERRHINPSASQETKTQTKPAPRHTLGDVQVATLIANARLLQQNGEPELALNLLREASNRDSKNPIVLSTLADFLELRGRGGEALKVREALVKYNYGFQSLFAYAQVLYKAGNDEQAMTSYFEALSVMTFETDELFEIHKNLGNIHVRRGDFEGAEEWYNKAHAINPLSDILHVNLGTLEVQRGDLGRSLQCFRKAVEINSKNDRAWAGLAMVHHEFGDFELAWGNLERAMDIAPENRTAAFLAAHWALRDKNPHRAIERLQIYLSYVESDEEISLLLVDLFVGAGRMDLAGLETARVLSWNPKAIA